MSSSIRQNYRKTDIYDQLVDEYGIFNSYVDLFVFAACRGYAEGERHIEDFEGDAEMLWMHFGNRDFYRAAAACIAYQTTEDPESLMDNNEQLKIMAQYASAGVDVLEKKYDKVKGLPLNSMMNDVRNFEPESATGDDTDDSEVTPLDNLHKELNQL